MKRSRAGAPKAAKAAKRISRVLEQSEQATKLVKESAAELASVITHGHDVGDLVLTTVAQRLKGNTRGDDTVSRLGGDEFLYLLMEVRDEQTITQIAEKILDAIQTPLQVGLRNLDLSLRIKASIGISVYPKDGDTVDTLVIGADLAMYQAKKDKSGFAFAT